VGSWHVRRNKLSALSDPKHAFQGNLLDAVETVEPNSVRWQDLNVTWTDRMDQMLVTNLLTFGAILLVALIVTYANEYSTVMSAFSIAGKDTIVEFCALLFRNLTCLSHTIKPAFNFAFPEFAKQLTNFEVHSTESSLQTSLYFKIAVFRWVNTAILMTVITPFTNTVAAKDGLIPQICTVFFAEIGKKVLVVYIHE
jgi:hypothetical protein